MNDYGWYLGSQIPATCRRVIRASTCRLTEEISFLSRPRPKPQSAIIVAGAERSGTTWLASLLARATNSQQINEPFSPEASTSPLYLLRKTGKAIHHRDSLSRKYLDRQSIDARATRTVYLTLTGRRRNYWTDFLCDIHTPDRYLIKTVHAGLMLDFIARRFQPTIIYIRRNPFAVVASRQRGFGGRFRDAMLARILDQQPVGKLFAPLLVSEMLAEKNGFARHAIEWAIEDTVVQRHAVENRIHIIEYETLIREPAETLQRISKESGLAITTSAIDIGRITHTSVVRYDNPNDRINSWRKQLRTEDRRHIANWLERIETSLIPRQKS